MSLSLGGKITALIVTIAVGLSGSCILVSDAVNRSTMDKEYMITADSMAATVAVTVDANRVQRFTEEVMEIYHNSTTKISNDYKGTPEFQSYAEQYTSLMKEDDYFIIQKELRKIQDVSEADYVYLVCVCPEDYTCVYIADGSYENIVPSGCFDMVEDVCAPYLEDLNQGFPAFITNTKEYGYVATACAPIYNSDGELVCFAAVDLSMNEVLAKENSFLLMLGIMIIFLTVILCFISIFYIKIRIVRPINLLSETAVSYGIKQNGNQKNFSSLEIHTGDEIELLHRSIVQMERDIESYIQNLTQTKKQLSSARQQVDDMQELAHMDSLTGIRNRLSYDKEIVKLDSEIQHGLNTFGIAMIDLNHLKDINDTYGHECGNTAIICLSRVTSEVFSGSQVYRVGGDEFVVILKNSDYRRSHLLIEEFNRRLEQIQLNDSLKPWEKISAAFGYAEFSSGTDHCADDVFRRADKNMYQRKKEMKAHRQ